ncbi:MAG: hypothetical protein AB7L09_01465 [Nitrospira sp.]
MRISAEQVEELKELLERHDHESDCHRTGECCAQQLIDYIEELLADE